MINRHLNQLTKCIKLKKSSKIHRVLSQPVKMLILKLLRNIAHVLNKNIKVRAELFWNEIMIVIIPETVSLHLFRYGYFEEGLTRMIIELLKPGMIFFDIGAHFGYYTLLSSRIVGAMGQVHSFEPTPSSFEILKLNTECKQNVTLNNIAVLSTSKKLELNDYGLEYCAFNSFWEARFDKNNKGKKIIPKKVKTKAKSIDNYVKEKDIQPKFIKIDAENSEWEILQGANYVLNNIRPIISIEVGDLDVKNVPTSRDIIQFLLTQGYDIYQYSTMDQPLVKHMVKESYNYDNLLFMPK